MFFVVDDDEEDIFGAEDADGLFVGEEGESAGGTDFEFLGVASDAFEELGGKDADGFGVEVRREFAGEEEAIGGGEHAALESGHLASEADDFLEGEFVVVGDAEESVEGLGFGSGEGTEGFATDAGNLAQVVEGLELSALGAVFDDALGEGASNAFDGEQVFDGAAVDVDEEFLFVEDAGFGGGGC